MCSNMLQRYSSFIAYVEEHVGSYYTEAKRLRLPAVVGSAILKYISQLLFGTQVCGRQNKYPIRDALHGNTHIRDSNTHYCKQ